MARRQMCDHPPTPMSNPPDPALDPNNEAYWKERGTTRPNLVWEKLSSSNNIESYRTKVPGGWFVYVLQEYRDTGGCFFYADPAHHWDGSGYHG